MRNPLRFPSPRSTSAPSSIAPGNRLVMALVAVFALSFLASACGGDETVEAGGSGDQEVPADDDGGEELPVDDGATEDDGETDDDPGDAAPDSGSHQITEARPDLISGQPGVIDDLVVVDDQTIGVRYQNGSEPCSLADVAVTESDTEIVVSLTTGLHPDAASMSCIAQVLDYEIQVTLDAPVGDRTIVVGEA